MWFVNNLIVYMNKLVSCFLVPERGYRAVFNATQYEFWVNAYAPSGSYVFTACLFLEDLNFPEGVFTFSGNLSEYNPFSINGSGSSVTFGNGFDYYDEDYDYYSYDTGNTGTVCTRILVNGSLEQDRTYQFELSTVIFTFVEFTFQTSVDVIIRTKGQYFQK